MRRTLALSALVLVLVVPLAVPAAASPPFPQTIVLTSDATESTGFRAEGIVATGRTAYAGSLATGTIVEIDLLTGAVSTLVPAAGGPAAGLALDGDRLFVAGGTSGQLRVYDTDTGEAVAVLQLAPAGTAFINDVVVSRGAAYATDSLSSTLYRVPVGRHGQIGSAEALQLTGDFELSSGFNGNGIEAAGSGELILAQSSDPADGTGSALYAIEVDTDAGEAVADRIELEGDVTNADGLVLRGRTLWVVENQQNRVAQVRLSGDLGRGTVVGHLTDPDAHTPTTATLALGALYAVNAHFADINGGADPATLDYEVIRIDLM